MNDNDPSANSPATPSSMAWTGGRLREALRPAFASVFSLTILTGCIYPLALFALGHGFFPDQAGGSLMTRGGVVVGSRWIGQAFTKPDYFQPRASAAGAGYDATSSGGTNLPPTNPKLIAAIRAAADTYRKQNGIAADAPIPIDAVTSSGSGLDPHISPENAGLQIPRVARARGLDEAVVRRLVAKYTEGRQMGFLGAPRVSVLELNSPSTGSRPMLADTALRWLECGVFIALVVGLAWPVGRYLACVFERRPTLLDPILCPPERLLLGLLGVKADQEMSASVYFFSFVIFSAVGTLGLFLLLMAQNWLPGGPDGKYLSTPMSWDLAANTAISFSTTTTWQAYAGESTMRYLAQAIGLVSQNFLAGAAGLAIGIAFIRGLARENSATVGSFWVDLVRAVLWVLLPLSLVGGFALVWQGVPLNLSPYTQAHTLEGGVQTIAQGPVAALEFIKNLGTNGGGFFNVNGAHPFENPTPLVGFIALLAIAVLPASLTVTFGRMTGRPRAGWVLLGVMVVLFVGGLAICDAAESANPPQLAGLHLAGGNMEGKEVRFGVGDSVLTAVVTSNGATGSYDSMHDSFQPIGVLVPLANMLLGEIVFGGLGTGIYSMVMIALFAVFLGGLMIGRTPAYLGKRLGVGETKYVALYALLTPAVVVSLAAIALTTSAGQAGLTTNSGTRGLTEVVYAYASSMANNGQTMAGLNANSVFYNVTTAIAMLAGRFGLAGFALALAGRFAAQPRQPTTLGTLPSDTIQFGVLVLGVVIVIGGLNFLPALALGPVAEALHR